MRLALVSVLLAGCLSPSLEQGEAAEDPGRFAVLAIDGIVSGKGPTTDSNPVCGFMAPEGRLDFANRTAWAIHGAHSFKAGETRLVILDRTRVLAPGRASCNQDFAMPMGGHALWRLRQVESGVGFAIRAAGDGLVIGNETLPPSGVTVLPVAFQERNSTFAGNLTFSHWGWWPLDAFRERPADTTPPYDLDGRVWWD